MKEQKLEPRSAVFEELLGEEFSARIDDQLVRFRLIEVSKLSPATSQTHPGMRQDSFSLLFKEVTDFQPGQGTFTCIAEAGSVDLFLVPVGSGNYEAIFN